MSQIHQILKQYWGFDVFRPLQEDIIQSVLQGKDTLALLPTGGGKSVCFQVPALALEGLCLVVSPLIALMKDQVYQLNKRAIKAAAVYSGMTYRDTQTVLDNCTFGNYKFLYISPERLATDDFRLRMQQMKINLLAIDEAHCISQWGYDFRPPYLRIAEIREQLKKVPVLALTATATPKVVEDIQEKLQFKTRNVFRKSFVRNNLSYVVRHTVNKEQSLLDILARVKGSGVVYVRNRRKTRDYADFLKKHGVKADFYHAGLEPEQRNLKQDAWLTGKTRVICCTNAFGMGIDKPDVRTVVHMDLPDSPEAYFQEAGRAGRDEQKAFAVQLVEKADIETLSEKVSEHFPEIAFIKEVYDELCKSFRVAYHSGLNESFDFDTASFTSEHKWSPLQVLSALKILEQQKFIYLSDGIHQPSQVKAVTSTEMLYKFQVEHKQLEPLVKFILRTSEGVFEDYVALDEEVVASKLKLPVLTIIEQLHSLNSFSIFSYKPRKNSPQVVLLQPRIKKDELRLNEKFIAERKAEYLERLKAMQKYVTETNVCRTRLLIQYFGETTSQDCGICDVCVGRKRVGLSAKEFAAMVHQLENALRERALPTHELYRLLNLRKENLDMAIEYLMEAGRVTKNAEGNLHWTL